jgi:two-component system cell cycle sensor histidine kinase/response regulator CckA
VSIPPVDRPSRPRRSTTAEVAAIAAVIAAVTWIADLVLTAPQATPGARLLRAAVTFVAATAAAVVITRLARRLRETERYWQNVFEDGPTAYVLVDGAGTIVAANALGSAQLGHTPQALVGRSLLDAFADDERASLREFLDRCLARAGESLSWEGWMVRRDGSRLRVRETGRAVRPAPDAPAVLLACEDVTERDRAEAERRASEARFRALVEHGLDLIAILDERGMHRYASPSYEMVLGYLPQEMVGTNAFDFVHPDDAATLQSVLAPDQLGQGPKHVPPVRIRHRDGSWRAITGTVTDMRREPAVGGIVANGRDVTEQIQLEAQLRQAQKMDAVGRLAGGVAHDFNNLLTVISGYSDFILAASPPGDERRADAEEIRRAADRAAQLTQQLLAFSRKQVLHPQVLDLNAVVGDASRMLRRLIGEDIRLELHLAPDAGAVRIDAGQLQQVLMNLAVNARDAMPLGGRLTIATAPVGVAREEPALPEPLPPGEYVRLAVTDTGAGMTPEVQARAFEPFFTTKEMGKGTGLGLSTVYGVVTQSRGRLRVDSAPGRGTTLEIFLPRTERSDVAAPPAAAAAEEGGTEIILLVEDDAMLRRLSEAALGRAGYRVLAAADAAEALRLAREHAGSIDLVVTDVVMPGMPGPELVARLEATRPELRVLYVSGYTEHAALHAGVSERSVSFLAKPFGVEALTRRVRELLDAEP